MLFRSWPARSRAPIRSSRRNGLARGSSSATYAGLDFSFAKRLESIGLARMPRRPHTHAQIQTRLNAPNGSLSSVNQIFLWRRRSWHTLCYFLASRNESFPLAIELTLQLERGSNSRAVVQELIRLGGWITDSQAESQDQCARLTFRFADRTSRDRFLRAALRVPGVARDAGGTDFALHGSSA